MSELRAQLAARDTVSAAAIQILYGGSMKPDNAKELLAQPSMCSTMNQTPIQPSLI
jgi:triosephosphate isomerase